MTTTKTLEELRAEAEATAKALHEAEERAAQEKRAKEQEEKRQAAARVEQQRKHERNLLLNRVAGDLQALDLQSTFTVTQHDTINCGDGVRITLEAETYSSTSSVFGRRPTGRVLLVVNPAEYGDRAVRYPPAKQGGKDLYNYTKVIAKVKEFAAVKRAREQQKNTKERQRNAAEKLAAEVRAQHGLENDNVVKGSYYESYDRGNSRPEYVQLVAPPGRVYVAVGTRAYTPEQAAVMLQALEQIKKLEPQQQR